METSRFHCHRSIIAKKKGNKKAKKQKQGTLNLLFWRPQSGALPMSQNKVYFESVIICRLREADFEKSSLAEFGGDARSFTGDREGCRVGGPWHARDVFGGPLALGSGRC